MVGHKLRLLIDERRATSGIWNPGSACLMSLGLKAICHLLFGWPTHLPALISILKRLTIIGYQLGLVTKLTAD